MNRRQLLVQKQFLNNEKAVVDRLQYIYDQSLFEINAKIRNLEFDIGDLREVYDWMDDDDPTKEVIRSRIQSKIYQKQYQQVLQDQVDGILKQMQKDQYLTVSDYLGTCYEDSFVGSLFDLHGQNVPMMMPIDQEAMVKAIQLDSKISKGLYTKLGEDVDVLKKRITSEVTRSIATGSSYEQVAQRLAGQTQIGFNKAVRIARTEGHRIQCSAAMDTMRNAKDMGADVVKQWDATLDGKTRPAHRKVDGEIREVDELFSNGLDFPGDPDGGAAEVVNCRCALLQRARWALDDGFTKMNNFTKQLETFDSPQKYDEFKAGFFSDGNVKYMNYVQQLRDKYGTRDLQKVLSMMTTREYNHYSRLLADNPVYNVKAQTVKRKAVALTTDMFPPSFTKTKAEAKNTQTIVDYVNGYENADPDVVELYSKMAELENIESNGIPFQVRHLKSSHVNYRYRLANGHLTEAEISYPKLTGDNPIGQLNTTLHEQMHLMDMYCRVDPKKAAGWFSSSRTSLVNVFKNTSATMSDDVAKLFKEFKTEYDKTTDAVRAAYRQKIETLKLSYYPDGNVRVWDDIDKYEKYRKEAKKIDKWFDEELDYQHRNVMGGGVDNLQDIYDALSGGSYRDNSTVIYGHGSAYYIHTDARIQETLANYGALSITRPDLIDMLKADKPELVAELEATVKEMLEKAGE